MERKTGLSTRHWFNLHHRPGSRDRARSLQTTWLESHRAFPSIRRPEAPNRWRGRELAELFRRAAFAHRQCQSVQLQHSSRVVGDSSAASSARSRLMALMARMIAPVSMPSSTACCSDFSDRAHALVGSLGSCGIRPVFQDEWHFNPLIMAVVVGDQHRARPSA